MMGEDSGEAARSKVEAFTDKRVVHAWDPERRLGDLYAMALKLRSVAWDVYFLYAPGVRWTGEEPPKPTFWMHQLPTEVGVDDKMLFNPGIFAQEIQRLLGNGAAQINAGPALELHGKGIFQVMRDKGVSSLEELTESIDDPATQAIAEEFISKRRET